MKSWAFLAIPVAVGIVSAYAIAGIPPEIEETGDALFTASRLAEGGSPIKGDPKAPITILEWGDYQCTYCFRFHESSLKALETEYIEAGSARLVFKDFPLNGPDSVLAAEASYCAQEQGKYWEYHDELYSNWAGERTGWITAEALAEFARSAGLEDMDGFQGCLDSHRHKQRVLEMEQFGRQIGVDATPSFFVFNDEQMIKIRGNQPLEVFKQAISELSGPAASAEIEK